MIIQENHLVFLGSSFLKRLSLHQRQIPSYPQQIPQVWKQNLHLFNFLSCSIPSSCLLARLVSTRLIQFPKKSLIMGSQFLFYFFKSRLSVTFPLPIQAVSSEGKLLTNGRIFYMFCRMKSLFFLAKFSLKSYLSNYGSSFLQMVANLDYKFFFLIYSICSSCIFQTGSLIRLKVNLMDELLNISYFLSISFVSCENELKGSSILVSYLFFLESEEQLQMSNNFATCLRSQLKTCMKIIQKAEMRMMQGSLKMLKDAEMMVMAPLMKWQMLIVYNPTMKKSCEEMLQLQRPRRFISYFLLIVYQSVIQKVDLFQNLQRSCLNCFSQSVFRYNSKTWKMMMILIWQKSARMMELSRYKIVFQLLI